MIRKLGEATASFRGPSFRNTIPPTWLDTKSERMGPPVPKRLNMPLMGGIPGSEKITFDQKWFNEIMHWYYSPEPITNLVKALKNNTATHFAVRNVTVAE